MITREQIENTPHPEAEAGSCGVSPVFAWAGKLVSAQWSGQDVEAICACGAEAGTRLLQTLKVVDWALSHGSAVTEVFRAPRLELKISKEDAAKLEEEAAEYDELTKALKSYSAYRYQETRNYANALGYYVRSNALLVVIGSGEQSRMVGLAGSLSGGITAMYNPSKPDLEWPNLGDVVGRVVREVRRSNWPAFVLHS